MTCHLHGAILLHESMQRYCRADSRLVPSQWETSLQSKAVSHWLGTNLESALYCQWNLKECNIHDNLRVRSERCGCLVTWFCNHLIPKPGNQTAAPLWPDPYVYVVTRPQRLELTFGCWNYNIPWEKDTTMTTDALAPCVTNHQQPSYWLCGINSSWSFIRRDFNNLLHVMFKMIENANIFLFIKMNSIHKGSVLNQARLK